MPRNSLRNIDLVASRGGGLTGGESTAARFDARDRLAGVSATGAIPAPPSNGVALRALHSALQPDVARKPRFRRDKRRAIGRDNRRNAAPAGRSPEPGPPARAFLTPGNGLSYKPLEATSVDADTSAASTPVLPGVVPTASVRGGR